MQNEIEKIAERYERRKAVVGGRYARFNPEVIAGTQERQRALVSLLKTQGIAELAGLDVLEIGCGSGSNLLELLCCSAQSRRIWSVTNYCLSGLSKHGTCSLKVSGFFRVMLRRCHSRKLHSTLFINPLYSVRFLMMLCSAE
jgi:hypothetical protein